MTRAAAVASLGAAAMTAVLASLRLGVVGPEVPQTADDLIPVLIATGFLCVIGLARRAHDIAARLATIGAAFTVTVDLAAYAGAVRPVVDEDAWRLLGMCVSVSALIAIGSATGYAASRPRLRRRMLKVEGAALVVVVAGIAGWAVARPSDSTFVTGSALGSLALVTRSFIVLTSAFTLIGVVGDVLPAADRASRRVSLTSESRRDGRRNEWLRAFIDELSPGRLRARRAVLAERSRVARDIHADVVPGLRQVLTDAERGVPPERLATSLRDVLSDVEAIGAIQHPVQLEIGGLVAALEWLAERVEGRSRVPVELLVVDIPGTAGEPPADVAAAAFRIGALALENVARHAPDGEAVVKVRAEAAAIDLSICDNGPGIGEAVLANPRADGRRGLVDMAAEAMECGGTVEVVPGHGGAGTCVNFSWRSDAPR